MVTDGLAGPTVIETRLTPETDRVVDPLNPP
jgi:hypothetical protein